MSFPKGPLGKTQIDLFFHLFICTFAAEMRRTLLTMGILTALCALCLTVLLNRQTQGGPTVAESCQHRESSVVSPQHQQHHEATLTDATLLYRICSSRPQRILPTQGSRNERTLTLSFYTVGQHFFKPLHSYFDSRCRLESAPFCLSASSDYYVIALRHIIR